MRILRFANFAHSELLTWGAYSALVFVGFFLAMDELIGGALGDPVGPLSFGWVLVAAAVLAGGLTAAIALLLDRGVFARLRRHAGHLTLVVALFLMLAADWLMAAQTAVDGLRVRPSPERTRLRQEFRIRP